VRTNYPHDADRYPRGFTLRTFRRPGYQTARSVLRVVHTWKDGGVTPSFQSLLPAPAAIGDVVTMMRSMHALSGAEGIDLAMAAMGLREALAMHGFGIAHLVAMHCESLIFRDLCLAFHAAFIGSFFCGVRVRRFLRGSARGRCSFVLRCGLIGALSRRGDRKSEKAKDSCRR
jgi:hypothetical protein